MTPPDLLRDALCRIVVARDALADGDLPYCADLLRDLETDLADAIARWELDA
jgi:hypothetical protein